MATLAQSIRRFGIIQPIVLSKRQDGLVVLVAGGRRLAACRSMGIESLQHGKDFVWRTEEFSSDGQLRLQAVELEENLRRKDLAWPEAIDAKLRLFDLMQSIHGVSRGFGAGKSKEIDGFSLRKLAEMLDENVSSTSRDIELAQKCRAFPVLATMPTKADAVRKLGVAVTVATMQKFATKSVVTPSPQSVAVGSQTAGAGTPTPIAVPAPTAAPERWSLYEGRFQEGSANMADGSTDLVLTDLPYNIGLGTSSASHSAGLGSFSDSDIDINSLCCEVAVESFRILRNDRFGVFFFGMNYYGVLYDALSLAGFTVDVYPFIWLRDRSAPPDGFARYSKTYDPALIVSKGKPRFIRPNLPNSLAVPSVRGPERLHAAQKPLAIMEKFVLDMTTPDCVVVDFFAGAGTTGEACLRNNRKAILFELEPSNCMMIRARLGAIK